MNILKLLPIEATLPAMMQQIEQSVMHSAILRDMGHAVLLSSKKN